MFSSTSTATGKDIHVVSMDVEAIAAIKKKNSKNNNTKRDVSRQWRSYRSTSFCVILQKDRLYFKREQIVQYFLIRERIYRTNLAQIKEA